jgi:ankyrin repeat protein
VEQFEVDECTDAEYFTRGLIRSTPLKDSRKSITALKSPPTSKNVKRSEREIFLEAQILELQRQLKKSQQQPEDVISDSKDNSTHHVSFNISVDSDSHNSNCSCDACVNNLQNVLLENLIIACKTADLATITYLLDQDIISVNIQEDKMGNSSLHFACANDSKGDVRVTQLLINKYKANKYLANDSGSTPLHYACINGFFDIVYDFIIHQGMSPDVMDKEGKTPLFNAAFNGHMDVVKLLISCNDNEGNRYCEPICDVNARSRSNWTSLQCACYNGHYEVGNHHHTYIQVVVYEEGRKEILINPQ